MGQSLLLSPHKSREHTPHSQAPTHTLSLSLSHFRDLDFSALLQVVNGPKWLQVAPVKAYFLLLGFGEIEACARPDVVDMKLAIPLPRHARRELRLNVFHEEVHGTPQ